MMLLHISDLHFGNKNRFSDDPPGEIGNAFCRALKIAADKVKTDSDISLVIVTGDLSESGLPSQFRYARDFLHSIGEYFSIGLDRFVILPGNHDISWSDCQMVRAGLEGEKFPKHEFDRRLNAEKLSNYRNFLSDFYGAPVTNEALAGLADARPLERGGWLRDFPTLRLSVAALNTSERENDVLTGGYLSAEQAQSLMTRWRETTASDKIKIIALHHNPVSTTASNTKWTIDWLRAKEEKAAAPIPMSTELFERYVADLAGFEGKEHLSKIVKDTAECAWSHKNADDLFSVRLARFRQLSRIGKWSEADALWPHLGANSDERRRAIAHHHRAISLHLRGELTEDELQKAEQASESVGSALGRRNLCSLRGWWLSDSENWKPARDCLSEALSLAHKVGKTDRRTEVRLALARFRLGEDVSVQEIADQVENTADVLTHLPLALLWLATGDAKKAESHALAAYKHAWADGAPYFHQYECSRAREILAQIGVMPPQLPAYRFETRDILAWEPQVARMIELQKVRHQRPTTEDG